MDTSHKNILRKGRKMEDVWCCRQATTCIAFLEQYFGCVKTKNRSCSPIFSEGRGASVHRLVFDRRLAQSGADLACVAGGIPSVRD